MNSPQAARSTTTTENRSRIEARENAAARAVPPMVLLLMGVSGSGKSTVALELHRVLGWPFQEGDDLHPPSNVEKMRSGRPLDDADRLQPGHPVGVIEWAAGTHFLDIRWRMEIVALLKRPAEDAMQFERDRRLAAAQDPHQHQHHRRNGSLGGVFRRLYPGTVSCWHCRLR